MNAFAGTASYYRRFRPGIPDELASLLDQAAPGASPRRLLDIGTGSGTVVHALHPYFDDVFAIDADRAMLTEADGLPRLTLPPKHRLQIRHVLAEDFMPPDGWHPQLVTCGRVFHWLDKPRLLERLDEYVVPEGTVAVFSDRSLWTSSSTWQQAARGVVQEFLGEERRVGGEGSFSPPGAPYEEMLHNSPFSDVTSAVIPVHRAWTIAQVIGYLYSTSFAAPHLRDAPHQDSCPTHGRGTAHGGQRLHRAHCASPLTFQGPVMDMNDADHDAALMADVLEDRYGLVVDVVEPVHMGTDTVNRRVLTEDGLRLYVKEYRATADITAARTAWDMSEYCRAARIPVPHVWQDVDGDLVTIAEGCAWAVTDEAPGRVSTTAMTGALAEHIGVVMGRMHRVLAAYPMPKKVQHSRWRTATVQDATGKCDSVLASALRQGHDRLGQLRLDLDQRREDLHDHVHRLRDRVPHDLVEQALHADLTRTNLVVLVDSVTGVIDFRGARAMPAWELGRAAFDPRTVANSPEWISRALAMASAYVAENPSLPSAELRACARITLLYMLFSLYGATTSEYRLPAAAEADLKQHWRERQTTIRLLLSHLDELDDAFSGLSAGGGHS